MIDVRVCPSCLRKRNKGLSRVSPELWRSCVGFVENRAEFRLDYQDETTSVFKIGNPDTLVMSDLDGPYVEDSLLSEVIRTQFRSLHATCV